MQNTLISIEQILQNISVDNESTFRAIAVVPFGTCDYQLRRYAARHGLWILSPTMEDTYKAAGLEVSEIYILTELWNEPDILKYLQSRLRGPLPRFIYWDKLDIDPVLDYGHRIIGRKMYETL